MFVDDDALIAALATGKLAAAGLDVFANEPQLDSRYFNLPNVLMTPHVGSSTREARVAMAAVLLDAMESWPAARAPGTAWCKRTHSHALRLPLDPRSDWCNLPRKKQGNLRRWHVRMARLC